MTIDEKKYRFEQLVTELFQEFHEFEIVDQTEFWNMEVAPRLAQIFKLF